jgi:hypothetical protein
MLTDETGRDLADNGEWHKTATGEFEDLSKQKAALLNIAIRKSQTSLGRPARNSSILHRPRVVQVGRRQMSGM